MRSYIGALLAAAAAFASGAQAQYSKDVRNGLEAYFRAVNRAGGRSTFSTPVPGPGSTFQSTSPRRRAV